MQIYLNISKKSQIINYKDNLFVLKTNILLVNFFLNVILLFFFSAQLSQLLLLNLLKYNLIKNPLFLLYFKRFNFFNLNIKIKSFINITPLGIKTQKLIYPVLKSPFIYKKAFRHFGLLTYKKKIMYSGFALGLNCLLTTNKVKIELLNSTKNIYVTENQFFSIY